MNLTARIAVLIATVGYIGRFPFAPGTVGSAVAVLLWWFFLAGEGWLTGLTVLVPLTILAVWSAHQAEKELGHDAHPIIIDEVVGQLLALLISPRTYLTAFLAFLLFRAFDILKPGPVNSAQKLPGGYGIVADDLLAGLFAMVILTIIQQFGIR